MTIIELIWFMLPAGVANMAAGVSAVLLPRFNAPLDFHKTFRGERILGAHKTWRGLFAGVAAGFLFFVLQTLLYSAFPFFQHISVLAYPEPSIAFGALLGFGALAGDAVKSFVKRQLGIAPGHAWFPLDQIDWVIGGLFVAGFAVDLSIWTLLLAFALGLAFHLAIKFVGYLFGLDRKPV